MIKLHAIGGYSEVGKNMTCVEIGEDAFIFDCGLYLPPVVELEDHGKEGYTEKRLRDIDAVPDDLVIKNLRPKVRAIFLSHAHLDHVGALPYLAQNYPNAPIIATPFTIEVLNSLVRDAPNVRMGNKIKTVTPNSAFTIKGKSKEYQVEFLNITHSTLQTAFIALHTGDGTVLYSNDFKLDNSPILGRRPNYERLKQLGKEGIKLMIVDSLYADTERKTPSEKVARGLLEDVLLTTSNEHAAIITTTFASHIARLKSIVDCGKQLDRQVIFMGRSMYRYVSAAGKLKLAPFMQDIRLLSYRQQVMRALKQISKARDKYLVVCTGHQGEPGSILVRMAHGLLPFSIQPKDHVVFSSNVIPTPINQANRRLLEKKLKEKGVRIFTEVHISGHAGREDLRDLIEMLNPENLVPTHGDMPKLTSLAELATELGYHLGKSVHIMQDGQTLNIS